MNQILSVENPKKEKKRKNNGPIELDKILKFFCVTILVFGVFMIGSGSYSMYQNSKIANLSAKPTIEIKETSATEITIQVTHNKELSKVTYNWNNEENIEIECAGKKKIEEKVQIPAGENTINIYAIDINGQESNLSKEYTIEGNVTIDIVEAGVNKVKVTAEGKEQLSYMTYRWDDEEETKIDINDIKTEQIIEVPKGLHTLTVIFVDINNNTQTKKQEVKGVQKPKLEVTTDGADNFIIKASDEEGIKRVEFIINETDKNMLNLDQVLPLEERKEFEYKYPLHDGENKLEVRVYNESDISEVARVLVRK